jgi:hypothetical protein
MIIITIYFSPTTLKEKERGRALQGYYADNEGGARIN